jgi:hypothetical protein
MFSAISSPDRSENPFYFLKEKIKRLKQIAGNSSK